MEPKSCLFCFLALALFVNCATADNANIQQFTADFDTTRYIDIDEIQPGMIGHGLTVFHGTEPEEFTVEVIGILRQFMPNQRGILVRVIDNPQFEQAAGVQGASGSPVYFDGRLAGAMAFGWSYGEEPLYGVTPIRDMLETRQASRVQNTNASETAGAFHFGPEVYSDMMRPRLLSPEQIQTALQASGLAQQSTTNQGLTTFPLTMTLSGINPEAGEAIGQFMPNLAFSVASGGSVTTTATSDAAGNEPTVELIPGGTLTIPLITGDMNGAILGTVTEVIDDQIYAFGHGWNREGATRWPMATGKVHTFISRTNMSFKLGEPLQIVGAILADESTAVYGEVGAQATMVPVTMHTTWTNTGFDETINAQIAQDELIDPILTTISLIAGVTHRGGLPREHTIDYKIKFSFDNMPPIEFANRSSTSGIMDLVSDSLETLFLTLNNPWAKLNLTDVSAEFTISHQNSFCMLETAQINQRVFQPGQTVNVQLQLKPIREAGFQQNISLELPNDLPEGMYTIAVGSNNIPARLIQQAQPNRARAFDLQTLHETLQYRLSLPRNAVYIGMVVPQAGIAIENDELPQLPGSRMMMLNDPSRRQPITPWQPVITNSIELQQVLVGVETFEIEVRKD